MFNTTSNRRSILVGLAAAAAVPAGISLRLGTSGARAADFQVFPRGARVPSDLPFRIQAQNTTSSAVRQTLVGDERFRLAASSRLPNLIDPPKGPLPRTFNWRALNRVTSVKNQLQCGSCWVFGAVSTYESAFAIANNVDAVKPDGTSLFDVSEQNVLDCGFVEDDCSGGWHEEVFMLLQHRGLADDHAYPYVGAKGQCDVNLPRPYFSLNWDYVTHDPASPIPPDDQMKHAIMTFGPIASAVFTRNWDGYRRYNGDGTLNSRFQIEFPRGVFAGEPNESLPPNAVDHLISIVGWDDDEGVWLIKNSWGALWGDAGFIKLRYQHNNIGFAAGWVMAIPPRSVSPDLERRVREIQRNSPLRQRYYPVL